MPTSGRPKRSPWERPSARPKLSPTGAVPFWCPPHSTGAAAAQACEGVGSRGCSGEGDGMHVIWPCGGVRPREMRVEGHGSPIAINKSALLLCCFRSFYSSAAIPERWPTPLHYPLVWGIGLRRLGCGCGRRLVTVVVFVIRETTPTGCPRSRRAFSVYLSIWAVLPPPLLEGAVVLGLSVLRSACA